MDRCDLWSASGFGLRRWRCRSRVLGSYVEDDPAAYPASYALLLTKLGVLLAALLVLMPAGILTWLAASSLADAVLRGALGFPSIPVDPYPTPYYAVNTSLSLLLVATLALLVYGSFTFFVTIVARSGMSGFAAGVISPLFLWVLKSNLLAWVLPNAHLENLFAHAVGYAPMIAASSQLFGREVGAWASTSCLLGFFSIFVGTSFVIFERRDVS